MTTFWRDCDTVLRGKEIGTPHPVVASPTEEVSAPPLRRLLLFIVAGGLLYGAVMGSYALRGGTSLEGSLERLSQMLYSALKVPLLLGVTALLSLPSFWLFNTLLGLGDDWGRVLRGLASAQSTLALTLAALCPFTLLCYASTDDYYLAVAFNAMVFLVASLCAQALLRRHYARLIARDVRHRILLRAWLLIYGFVGIQMGWVLRPFVGDPTRPTAFFREGAWSNAYEVVAHLAWRVLSGHGMPF